MPENLTFPIMQEVCRSLHIATRHEDLAMLFLRGLEEFGLIAV